MSWHRAGSLRYGNAPASPCKKTRCALQIQPHCVGLRHGPLEASPRLLGHVRLQQAPERCRIVRGGLTS
jgi:hypothetical protein